VENHASIHMNAILDLHVFMMMNGHSNLLVRSSGVMISYVIKILIANLLIIVGIIHHKMLNWINLSRNA